jgi:SAM-dependent methyltransferase
MITFRRKHLDRVMNELRNQFSGDVLDIGGEKKDNRSQFIPPFDRVKSWTSVNIDAETGADIIAPADRIPLNKECADWVIMTELLEHVSNPAEVLSEAERLLKGGGKILITMPFLYQVHGDPHDYARWTADMMRRNVSAAGLEVKSLEPMGGLFCVIYDLVRAHVYRCYQDGTLGFKIRVKLLQILAPVFFVLDGGAKKSRPYITTGWAVVAEKPA